MENIIVSKNKDGSINQLVPFSPVNDIYDAQGVKLAGKGIVTYKLNVEKPEVIATKLAEAQKVVADLTATQVAIQNAVLATPVEEKVEASVVK